ncbi:MAG: GPP34 family phosphoprotein, partial [Anaerolineae bacterium]|nr:GPP34 family phosphoprotein [Anaerolineae bacterium]
MLNLTLPEALFILGLNDEKLRVHRVIETPLYYGISAAILAELALLNRINLKPKGKIILENSEPCQDEILDNVLSKIINFQRNAKVHFWMDTLSIHQRKTQKNLMEQLNLKQVISSGNDQKVEWVIPDQPASSDPGASAKFLLKEQLRKLLLTKAEPDDFNLVLLFLVYTCSMMGFLFTRDEQKTAAHKLEILVKTGTTRQPLASALEIVKI